MCGRFAQSQTREDYLALLAEDIERDIPYDPEPIGRYNVAPGTKVLLLSERDEHHSSGSGFLGICSRMVG